MSGPNDGKSSLARFIRWVMRDVIAYQRVYTATVMAPSAGTTVDLMPDDPEIAGNGFQGVPVMYGLPDCVAQFAPGVKMLLLFESGDQRKPRAICFDGAAIMLKLGGGSMPVARVGDSVAITSATSVSGGAVTGTATIVGGSAKVMA